MQNKKRELTTTVTKNYASNLNANLVGGDYRGGKYGGNGPTWGNLGFLQEKYGKGLWILISGDKNSNQ